LQRLLDRRHYRAVPDLSPTALYTAETWRWAGFACADLLATDDARRVFAATNAALAAAGVLGTRAAPLRVSLVQRHALIDQLAREAGAPQIIELAAGLSPRGASFTGDGAVARYVEIDLPAMVARKRALLSRTALGRAVLERATFRLVAGDALAIDLAGVIAPGGPVCVIAEGLLMYLDAAAQAQLFANVRALGDEVSLVFDLVPPAEQPAPTPAGRVLAALMRRATGGGEFVRDGRSRADILAALSAAGFDAEAIDTRSVASARGLPFPDAATRMVVFSARARARAMPR
jgi:O-methyltransferase involved in polyketide biosynthesis